MLEYILIVNETGNISTRKGDLDHLDEYIRAYAQGIAAAISDKYTIEVKEERRVKERIGKPTRYYINIYRKRRFWFREKLLQTQIPVLKETSAPYVFPYKAPERAQTEFCPLLEFTLLDPKYQRLADRIAKKIKKIARGFQH